MFCCFLVVVRVAFDYAKAKKQQSKYDSLPLKARFRPQTLAFRFPCLLLWYTVRLCVIPIVVSIAKLFGWSRRDLLVSFFRKMAAGHAKAQHDALAALSPRAGDIWVCSYMKNGTNFTLQAVSQVIRHGAMDYKHIHEICPWPEMEAKVPPGWSIRYADAPAAGCLRAVKTHANFDRLPQGPGLKYVLMVRNPKSTCISAWHFSASVALGVACPSLADFVDIFIDGSMAGESWAEVVASYWTARTRSDCLLLFYEDMCDHLQLCIEKIADHVGVRLTDLELQSCIAHSTFAFMKQHQSCFVAGAFSPLSTGGIMIRAGSSNRGGELTQGQRRRIDEAMERKLLQLGSDFPYDRYKEPS